MFKLKKNKQQISEKETKQESVAIEYEICVLCDKVTDVPRMLDIRARRNYVEGCGQMCDECAKRIEHEQIQESIFHRKQSDYLDLIFEERR